MMMSTRAMTRYAAPTTRLLGGWKDVSDDIRKLVKALDGTPDDCACGDVAGHLAATCPCCCDDAGRTTCESCGTIIRSLNERFELLLEDRLRFLPAVREMVEPDASRRLGDLSRAIDALVRTFDRLQVATDEFAEGCSTSHLRVLRALAHELSADAKKVEEAL
jgi:hypothetical protein